MILRLSKVRSLQLSVHRTPETRKTSRPLTLFCESVTQSAKPKVSPLFVSLLLAETGEREKNFQFFNKKKLRKELFVCFKHNPLKANIMQTAQRQNRAPNNTSGQGPSKRQIPFLFLFFFFFPLFFQKLFGFFGFFSLLTSLLGRLMKEVKDFCKEKADGVSAFPDNARGILFWKAKIVGAAGTPYAGQTYELQLEFPEVKEERRKKKRKKKYSNSKFFSFQDYPMRPPTVMFVTPCYHPNVHESRGDICLDILQVRTLSPHKTNLTLVVFFFFFFAGQVVVCIQCSFCFVVHSVLAGRPQHGISFESSGCWVVGF